MAEREFTGKHALALFVVAFGVIIAVNLVLAVSAVRTFPGLEVKNSYVASQSFDERRRAQEALGWQVRAEATGTQVIVTVSDAAGGPARVESLGATIGRATEAADDIRPAFRFDGTSFVAPAELGPGKWIVRLEATAPDGTAFTQRIVLNVGERG